MKIYEIPFSFRTIGYQFIIFILQGRFLLYLHEFDQELYLIKHLHLSIITSLGKNEFDLYKNLCVL